MAQKRTAKNMPRGNGYTSSVKAAPQSFPQTLTTPDDIGRSRAMNSVDNDTSIMPRPVDAVEATPTWSRPIDHVRPLPERNKNRHTYSEADMHQISSGGVVDASSKLPTHSDGNRW